MKRFIALIAVSLAVLAPWPAPAAVTSSAPPVIHDITQLPGGQYVLDKDHAHIVFFVSHLGFSNFIGAFDNFDAQLLFHNHAPLQSKLDVTIDANSVDTKNQSLDDKLRSDDFFNVAQYSQIKFVSRDLKQTDARHGIVTGDLTLLGVTKPVSLQVEFVGGGFDQFAQEDKLGFQAYGKIKRSDFGMTSFIPVVGDEVELNIAAEFALVKTAPPSPRQR